jgi:hypothetical protein
LPGTVLITRFLAAEQRLAKQRAVLTTAREEQMRSSEIALRELHTDLIRMAIDDTGCRRVPAAPVPGGQAAWVVGGSR